MKNKLTLALIAAPLCFGSALNSARADVLSSYTPQASEAAGSTSWGTTWTNQANGQNFLVKVDFASDVLVNAFSIYTFPFYYNNNSTLTLRIWNDVAGTPTVDGSLNYVGTGSSDNYQTGNTVAGLTRAIFNVGELALSAGTYWMGLTGSSNLVWTSDRNGPVNSWQLYGNELVRQPAVVGSLGYVVEGTSVTAVPGPEAGAGLGALAMLGVAYWAKRRRDEKAIAA